VGGFNTLYAAFSSRIAELATLQVLGYSRTAILVSLIQESLMACLTGALLAGFLSSWLLDGLIVSFSMGTFTLRTGPAVLLSGIITGSALGLFGSIPPAIRCFRPSLPSALRSAA
jgi:ABC-type antimicrobial peptide transport system permease subunit